jgi:hypothetical protein
MLHPTTILRQASRQVSCTLNDEVAVLNLDQAVYYGLEGVGGRIWQALAEPRSVAELCAIVLAEFDVSRAECEADVVRFLEHLQDIGLIEPVE